jgi:hypothetical protein
LSTADERTGSRIQQEAERGGAHAPAPLARQFPAVYDGASFRAVVQAQGLDGLAVATVSALLDSAGVARRWPISPGQRRRPE